MSMAEFKLSAQLLGHEADVRAVSFPHPDVVLSASRDCSVRLWRRDSNIPTNFNASLVSRGSEFVNSLAFVPATKDYPDGLVVSGGKDTIIEVKSPLRSQHDNAERLLVGHAHNVCALDVSPKGDFLVSGGWDGQARVWEIGETWQTKLMLGGHEGMAVWAVLALDDHTVVTGCADKSIRIFDIRKSTANEVAPRSTIYVPDVVRALCKVPEGHPSGAEIASASNDGVLRLWKLNGQQVGELHGHDSFVYCLASLPSGELVSAGEDRTVRIWRGSECVQTITHPAISVWTVAVNQETGDIVSGASDCVARVFTRHQGRVADKESLAEFEESIKKSSIPQQQMGSINKEKLPGPDFLQNKSGTKEGQVQMIREGNGSITAHQWSMAQQQWVNVGTVVDAVGSTGKKVEHNGQSYDFVFDVDIEDGKPPLKLPYNLSENPYDRATKFLNDNELPLSYLDNVANFITENTKGHTLGQPSDVGAADPLGTGSRYRPGDATREQESSLIPQREYLSITAAKYEAIFNKIASINKNMIASGRKEAALNPTDLDSLDSLRQALENSKAIPSKSLEVVVRITSSWPYSDRLPTLDLLRCMARYPTAAQFSDSRYGSLLDLAFSSLPSDFAPNENAVMMGCRIIANLFGSADGRSVVNSNAGKVIGFLEQILGISGTEPIGRFNRNLLIAITTCAINMAVMSDKERLLTAEQRRRLAGLLGKILTEQSDSEVLYRGLVALGTMVPTSKEVIKDLGVLGWIEAAVKDGSEDRVRKVADECMRTATS
ncbi:WD40-repeat-containing domain protein [Stachybotrys elegans]|uniref:WD40-repeat-containing domain protein n=1 Tax=Stachybotrys elegans TaxID=80388 RepID=A0A8K0WM01_9HYPO|nr:WD40-repeat-containing domain protein [Stachybotrys elegans]